MDVANLEWKLSSVLKGAASESLLDTYQVEQLPQITTLIKTAVMVGKMINGFRAADQQGGKPALSALSKQLQGKGYEGMKRKPVTVFMDNSRPHEDLGRVIMQPRPLGQPASMKHEEFPDGHSPAVKDWPDDILGKDWSLLLADSSASPPEPLVLRLRDAVGLTVVTIGEYLKSSGQKAEGFMGGLASGGRHVLVRPDRVIFGTGPSAQELLERLEELLMHPPPVAPVALDSELVSKL